MTGNDEEIKALIKKCMDRIDSDPEGYCDKREKSIINGERAGFMHFEHDVSVERDGPVSQHVDPPKCIDEESASDIIECYNYVIKISCKGRLVATKTISHPCSASDEETRCIIKNVSLAILDEMFFSYIKCDTSRFRKYFNVNYEFLF